MLRFTTRHTGRPGSPYYSTFYTLGTTQAHADQGVVAIHDFWAGLSGFITSGLSSVAVLEVEELDVATGQVQDVFPVADTPVASTGNAPLPPSVQGLLRLRSSTFGNGRRIQGRLFIPSLANDAQLVGEPSAGFLASLDTAGATLITDLTGGGNDWCVYSRPNDALVPPKVGAAAVITSTNAWTRFAVLRSRRD